MGLRGPKSAASLQINNVDGSKPRLRPPPGLNAKERALFLQLVNACSPDHLRPADAPLLVAFVQSVLISHKLGRERDPKIKEWELVTRTLASLATRLRLSPASRTRPESIARMRQRGVMAPWHDDDPPWADERPHPNDPSYDSNDEEDEKNLQ
jgi:hypothetical protein